MYPQWYEKLTKWIWWTGWQCVTKTVKKDSSGLTSLQRKCTLLTSHETRGDEKVVPERKLIHTYDQSLTLIGWLVQSVTNYRNINLGDSALLPGMVVTVRISSIGKIELFNHQLGLKPFNYVQIKLLLLAILETI